MINQKINPVMGHDDIEVLRGTTNASSVSFTPRNLRTNDMVIGFWLRVGSFFMSNTEDTINLRIDGVLTNDTTTRSVTLSRCAGVAVKKLTAPATTVVVEAGSTTSGITKNAVLVVVPSTIFSSGLLNNNRRAAVQTTNTFTSVNVDVTADKPAFFAGIQEGSDTFSITNLGTQVVLLNVVTGGDRIIAGYTTSPTSSPEDGTNIFISGLSNTDKGLAVASLT